MNKIFKKKYIIIILLTILLSLNFKYNFLTTREEDFSGVTFEKFQGDSENLVLSKIFQDKFYKKSKYGLSKGDLINPETKEKTDTVETMEWYIQENKKVENLKFSDYTSQFGLQGFIYNFLYSKLNISLNTLRTMNCMILAIVLVSISSLIFKKYGKILGSIFYLVFFLSPWIIAFARNLYWVEFTWFLPALFALLLSCNYSKKKLYIPLIFISVLIKCLCGYEYISTILLFTISFFIIDFFISKDKKERKKIFITTFIVGIACLLSFFTALCLHSVLRGNGDVLKGIKTIYKEDVLRRTLNISETNDFLETELGPSIESNVITTVKTYFKWNTNVILGIEGQYFKLMIFISLIILIYELTKKEKNSLRNLIMFIVFLLSTLSWYILGKAHSYIHTHMNYVLWYFGFVQICIYIITKFSIKKLKEIQKIKIDE